MEVLICLVPLRSRWRRATAVTIPAGPSDTHATRPPPKKTTCKTLCVSFFTVATATQAATAILEQVPTAWRLENYAGDNVVTYFTASSCPIGMLTFGSKSITEDRNRFWALVMTAKISGKRIGVAYDDATVGCQIISFYFKEA